MIRILLCIIGFFFVSLWVGNTRIYAAVVINELLPKTDPASGEWVELYNTGSDPVSLNQWKIQTTTGFVQTYILNAAAIIPSRGFLTLKGSQTGISFSIDGDTVRLFDENNTEIDNQSYPGVLGFNTSMGRNSDGEGLWTPCVSPTYNGPNNCPRHTSAPTPVPTKTPTPIPYRTPTPIPTPSIKQVPALPKNTEPTYQTFGSFLPSPSETQVLGDTDIYSPTPTSDPTNFTIKMDKILAYQILAVIVCWSLIAAVAYIRKR